MTDRIESMQIGVDELRAAKERIRELTEKLDCANALSKRNGLAYCAEREVSDKLEKALEDFTIACDPSICSGAELAAYHKARTALAEVASIRAKGDTP